MFKKYFVVVFVICSSVFWVNLPRTYALFGVGDLVFDATNYAQLCQNYLDQVRNTLNSFLMLQNQLTQITYEAQNLIKMDGNLSTSNILNIQQSLSKLIRLTQSVRGIAMNYEQSQSAWDTTYPGFEKYNSMSGADYANQNKIIRNQTSNAIFDAMTAQGLVAQLGNDSVNLNTLLNASANADGLLAAIQAGNQIAGLEVQQLMRMQQIMASSYRAESSYYAEEVQGKAAAVSNANKMMINSRNTLSCGGNGTGIVGF